MAAERIALGTAQFGLPYGIANAGGQVAPGDITTILAEASNAGMDTVDTAIAYGDAESCLGAAGVSQFRVVSKLPPVPEGITGRLDVLHWVEQHVAGSLRRLRIDRLHAVLLHRPADLSGPAGEALGDALLRVRDAGWVTGIGLSVYAPTELDVLSERLPWSVVQLPCSVLDQRFVASGWVARLHAAGVEVHTRSAFLQGLLLMSPARRPVIFSRWTSTWMAWESWLAQTGQTAVQGCLAAVLAVPGIARVVVGIDGPAHLREIVSAVAGPLVPPPAALASDDPNLVDPTRWPSEGGR